MDVAEAGHIQRSQLGTAAQKRSSEQHAGRVRSFLGVGFDLRHQVKVMFDHEVEAPRCGYAGLPKILRFVVLLGPKGRVPKVLQEQLRLFVKRSLDSCRCLVVVSV